MEIAIGFALALAFLAVLVVVLFKKVKGTNRTVIYDPETGRPITVEEPKFKGPDGIVVTKEIPKPKRANAKNEHFYNELLAEDFNAESGVKLDNGLVVDMLTETHAFEIDFGGMKIYEGIGQSLAYAYFTEKKPGLIILVRDDKEQKMLNILTPVILKHGIDLFVYRVTDRIEGKYEKADDEEGL